MNYVMTSSNSFFDRIHNTKIDSTSIKSYIAPYTTSMNTICTFNAGEAIVYNGKKLFSIKPLEFTCELIDNEFVCDYPELDIYACGGTYSELIEDIKCQIFFAWDEYANEDDSKLVPKALEFKNFLRTIFKVG